MSKDTTQTTNRRSFLRTSGMAGAALLGATIPGASAAFKSEELTAAELAVAAETIVELRIGNEPSRNGALLLLITEHIGTLAVQGALREVESVVRVIRDQVMRGVKNPDARVPTLLTETRASLARVIADEAAGN